MSAHTTRRKHTGRHVNLGTIETIEELAKRVGELKLLQEEALPKETLGQPSSRDYNKRGDWFEINVGPPPPPNAPMRAIPQVVEDLDAAISLQEKLVADLRGRLDPLCAVVPAATAADRPMTATCKLSAELSGFSNRVLGTDEALTDLLARLQI